MQTDIPSLNWQNWMQRWDQQQSWYMPDREERFAVMLDVLSVSLPESFVALDLACGPGSISQRLLTRFTQARCIALDFDPVLLLLGQQVLGDMQGRLRWVEANLREPSWYTQLGEQQVDAVLSTTALHWLPAESLVHLYHQLGKLIRPGGIFLNGDHLPFATHLPTIRRISETIQRRNEGVTSSRTGGENWAQWWEALKGEPGMEPLFTERQRRFIDKTHHGYLTLADLHKAALLDAGFREVDIIWQHLDNRVIMAIR